MRSECYNCNDNVFTMRLSGCSLFKMFNLGHNILYKEWAPILFECSISTVMMPSKIWMKMQKRSNKNQSQPATHALMNSPTQTSHWIVCCVCSAFKWLEMETIQAHKWSWRVFMQVFRNRIHIFQSSLS